MGLSSKKTTATNEPSAFAKPYIADGANTLKGAYQTAAPTVQANADMIGTLLPSMIDRAQNGTEASRAGNQYITDTLGRDPTQNPYLQQMIDITNDSTRNSTQASMGTRGQTGGSAYADMISRNLANNESGLRYQDYDAEMARKQAAAGMVPGMVGADLMNIAPAMAIADYSSMAPLNAASQYAGGVGGLLGQYQTQTQKQSGGLLGDIVGAGLSGWASGGFKI